MAQHAVACGCRIFPSASSFQHLPIQVVVKESLAAAELLTEVPAKKTTKKKKKTMVHRLLAEDHLLAVDHQIQPAVDRRQRSPRYGPPSTPAARQQTSFLHSTT
jgi:hypothetical protein